MDISTIIILISCILVISSGAISSYYYFIETDDNKKTMVGEDKIKYLRLGSFISPIIGGAIIFVVTYLGPELFGA